MTEVVVQDHDPAWPRVFAELRSFVWTAVSDIAVSIEHVGSTSVPGLAAKPVIDMDVVVAEGDVATGIKRLAPLGYTHQGDLGIAGREAFGAPAGSPRHHLYLCPSGSPALANHLAIRDYLRDASAAKAYGELKKRLAREFLCDMDGYVEAKTDFLVGILKRVGFPEDDLAEIGRMNARSRKPKEASVSSIKPLCTLLAAFFLVGCDEPIDCCQDPSTWGVVAGAVLDENQIPQVGVVLEAINFQLRCEGRIAPGPFGLAHSDDRGEFEMLVDLFLMRAARYCFEIVMTRGDAAHTVTGLEVQSFERRSPPDTTRVILVVPW